MLLAGQLDVHFTSPAPVYGFLGARASSPLLKQARRLRSQETGGEFTKQTSRVGALRCDNRSTRAGVAPAQPGSCHSDALSRTPGYQRQAHAVAEGEGSGCGARDATADALWTRRVGAEETLGQE